MKKCSALTAWFHLAVSLDAKVLNLASDTLHAISIDPSRRVEEISLGQTLKARRASGSDSSLPRPTATTRKALKALNPQQRDLSAADVRDLSFVSSTRACSRRFRLGPGMPAAVLCFATCSCLQLPSCRLDTLPAVNYYDDCDDGDHHHDCDCPPRIFLGVCCSPRMCCNYWCRPR